MAKDLRCSLHQLALRQVDHEAGGGQPPHSLQRVLQHLILRISEDRDVVQVDDHRQRPFSLLRTQHILHDVLKVRRRLSQPHRHPQPAIFPTMRHKGGVIRRVFLKDDVVKPRFQINHRNPVRPT